ARLTVLPPEDDVKAGRRVGVRGHIGHLAESMAGRLLNALLISGHPIELAGAATPAAFIERASPRGLLVVDTLHRLEDGGAADSGHRGQRRGKAAGGGLVLAARV